MHLDLNVMPRQVILRQLKLSFSWVQLYKGQIMLSNGQISIRRISDCKTYSVFHGIAIYPVDGVIQPSNNWG